MKDFAAINSTLLIIYLLLAFTIHFSAFLLERVRQSSNDLLMQIEHLKKGIFESLVFQCFILHLKLAFLTGYLLACIFQLLSLQRELIFLEKYRINDSGKSQSREQTIRSPCTVSELVRFAKNYVC